MNKFTRQLFAFWVITAGSFGSPQPCFADSVVTLHPEIELSRPTVRLSDVFTGVPAEIDREIAQAPAPGKQMVYDVNVLTRLAQKYRLDWQAQSVADHVTVKTACIRITSDMIRDAVTQKIAAATENSHKNSEIDVAFDTRALEIDIPVTDRPDFTLNNFDFDALTKRFHADLVTASASGPSAYPVAGHITIKRNIPVLAHRLDGGTVIGTADLDWMLVPEDRINVSVVTEASQLVGRELRRDTQEDEPLHVQDVMQPRLVKRGAVVTMKIETPLMQITAQGKAMQDGVEGDVVRVTNTQSNRVVEGTVTGPGVVTIHTVQKFAEAR